MTQNQHQTITGPDRQPSTSVPHERRTEDTRILDDADQILDEIDALLEDNVLEVVRTFRQRGGE